MIQQLERAISVYEAWLAAGRPLTPAQLLDQHSEIAEFLEAMLKDRSEIAAAVAIEDGGRTLGDFRLLDEIGRGGMGVVYRARQISLDREVALKVLPGHITMHPSAVARFRREAMLAARLEHPNIVRVFAVGDDGDDHFFAMELIDGAPLGRIDPTTSQPRSVRQCVELCIAASEALACAHAAGVLHRDVKPSNILVRRDGGTVLTDFGLAREFEQPGLTRTGAFAGTPHYAAPEQITGSKAIDARADLFSLGVTLYELLTGRRPFDADTTAAVFDRIVRTEPSDPQRLAPELPTDLAAIVLKALEKEPARRYQSAREFGADLRAFLEFRPVSARRATPWQRLRRWAGREPARAALTAVLAIGGPALTVTLAYLWHNAPRIESAREAEVARVREEDFGAAWEAFYQGEPDRALQLLDGMESAAPGLSDLESSVSKALMLIARKRGEDALRVLAPHAGDTVELLRAAAADPLQQPGAADVHDALGAFVRAQIWLEGGTLGGRRHRERLQQAVAMSRLAVELSPVPRLAYFVTMAAVAEYLEDRGLGDAAIAGMAAHFPGSRVATRMRVALLARHRPEAALDLLATIPRDDRSGLEARLQAVAWEALGKLVDAAAANEQAVEMRPQDGRAWTNLGIVRRKQKMYPESIAALRRATALAPDSSVAWNALGLALRAAGDAAAARHAFERALELRDDYAAAAYNLGNLLVAQQDLDGAIAAFRRAVAADPADVKCVANLGDALQRAGRRQEAFVTHLRAMQLAPGDMIPNHNVAAAALDLGLAELALEPARRARDLDKTGFHGLRVYAEALLAQPDVDSAGALAAAREADARAKGGNLRARVVLAKAISANGDRAQALELLAAAAQDPTFQQSADRQFLERTLTRLQRP